MNAVHRPWAAILPRFSRCVTKGLRWIATIQKSFPPDAGMSCFAMVHAEGFHFPPKQWLRYLVQIAKPPLRKLAEPMGTLPFCVKRVERK